MRHHRNWLFWLCLPCLMAAPAWAQTTHEVVLSGLSFAPQELRIQVGDTVRWRNQSGFHDVVADDGAFRSGAPTSNQFSFEVTFSEPGTFGYFCSVHGSPGEGMFGRIIVEGVATAAPQLSRAHSGSWFNSATDGQGFLVEVSADPRVFTVAWFTWGEGGSYDWLTGAGDYQDGTATLALTRTRGGAFNDPQPVSFSEAGTASFRLSACDAAEFSFALTDPPRSGTIPLRKLLPPGPECTTPTDPD